MKPTRRLPDWESVLLDTSVILNYLKSGNGEDQQAEKIRFTKRLLDFLMSKKPSNSRSCRFLISSISLSEIKHLSSTDSIKGTFQRIVQALNSADVEFIPFNNNVAIKMNGLFSDFLYSNQVVNEFAKKQGLFEDNLALAREWISRDAMIIASGLQFKVDVILTDDSKTFEPLTQKVDAPCLICRPECFNSNEKYIFDFV